ncbi:MAG: XRE family transcriptional regulator [Alcanivorax sp.]|nr:XRE family transcriptional regulator [Alcanivorax sp.]
MFFAPGTDFSRAEDRALAREDLIYNVTEDMLVAMERADVSKKELARRLGRSKSYVTQLLSGARNMTLGTLSDICFALDITPRITILDAPASENPAASDEGGWEAEDIDMPRYEVLQRRNIIDRQDRGFWVTEAA